VQPPCISRFGAGLVRHFDDNLGLYSCPVPTVETVSLLLSYRAISPNGVHPPGSGTTPLHLAASLGRVNVVKLLLDQDGIDDTLRDATGKTCRDVAKGKEVVRVIEGSFASFSLLTVISSYFRFTFLSQCILPFPTPNIHSVTCKHTASPYSHGSPRISSHSLCESVVSG
jgi:ankyrin repeat protein